MHWPFADAGPLLRALFRCPAASGGWNPGAKTGGTDGLARFFLFVRAAPPDLSAAMTRLCPPPLFLPLRLAAPSCRSVLPPCSAALFCAPSCRSVLLSILLPRPAAPPSGFGRIRPDGACHFLPLPSVRGKSACGETPFLHDLTRAATKNDPVEGRFHRVASPLSRRYRRIRRPAPPRARPVRGLRRAPSCTPSRSALSP